MEQKGNYKLPFIFLFTQHKNRNHSNFSIDKAFAKSPFLITIH
jgi:hypothetical protein